MSRNHSKMNERNINKRPAKIIHCCAATCHNTSQLVPEISYFFFPKDEARRRIWVLNSRRKDLVGASYEYLKNRTIKLCAEHFERSQFNNYICNSLLSHAIPTVFYEDEIKPKVKANIDEYEKLHPKDSLNLVEQCEYIKTPKPPKEVRIKRFIDVPGMNESLSKSNSQSVYQSLPVINSISLNPYPKLKCEAQSQTTITTEDMNRVDHQCEEVNTMLGVLNEQLAESSLNSGIGQCFLQQNPTSVPFYTGFSDYRSLMKFYDEFQSRIESHYDIKLSKFQEMILFLSHLRLNLPIQDLVFRYNLSKVMVFHVYRKWLILMCEISNTYLKIPERKQWGEIYQPVFQNSIAKLHSKITNSTIVEMSQSVEKTVKTSSNEVEVLGDHSYNVVNEGTELAKVSDLENLINKRKDQSDDKNDLKTTYKRTRVETSQNIRIILIEMREVVFKEPDSKNERTLLLSDNYNLPTLKFLVALSLAGKIIFASKTFYGSTKNSYILENCGLLQLIQVGDIFLSNSIFCETPLYRFTCAELFFIEDQYSIKYYNPDEIENLKNLKTAIENKFIRIRNKYAVLRDQVVIDIEDLVKSDLNSKMEGVSHMIKVSCVLTNVVNSNLIG